MNQHCTNWKLRKKKPITRELSRITPRRAKERNSLIAIHNSLLLQLNPIKRQQIRAPRCGMNRIMDPNLLDTLPNGLSIFQVLQTHKVDSQTDDMRRGHRRPRSSMRGVVGTSPGREDIDSRGEDVDNAAVVGEFGSGVVAVDCCDGEGIAS